MGEVGLFLVDWPPSISTLAVPVLFAVTYALYVWARSLQHPLRSFPGPWSARFSNFHYCRMFLSGRQPFDVLELHEKYGPIVRTAPNDLSFISSQAWRDIYTVRKGHLPFIKSDFYDGGNFAGDALSIVSERNPHKHGQMRKYLASAFSDRSLREQESMIAETTDKLIGKLISLCDAGEKTDMVMWYNLATFDIIGDLAFGESFGGVDSGVQHPWISTVIKSLYKGALGDCMKRFPWIAKIVMTLLSRQVKQLIVETRTQEQNSRDLVKRRIARTTNRRDFITNILEARKLHDISETQIAAHTSDFVIAGSETTATALACATYYLIRDPGIAAMLRKELDQAIRSYESINAASTAPLEYLTAVCKEAMRLYPPLPFALPRVVPAGGDTVDGHFLPAGVVVSAAPLASSVSGTNFHEPWKFKPERWLNNARDDDLEASQPFSMGPRGCMGRSMGWVEMRTILSKIMWTFDLELVDGELDWHRDSKMHTLWQKPQLLVNLKRRIRRE